MLTLNPVRVHAAAIQTAAARVHRSKNITTTKFGCRALLAFALSAAFISSAAAQSLTPIRFTLDFKHQGIHAWYYVAQEKGYFKAEGLDVKIDQGEGSAATITRIMSGAYDAGFGDMNAIIQMAAAKPGEAQSRGANVATNSTLKSMGLSRAAGALGELKADTIAQSQIGDDGTLYSGRASCSAGIELLGHENVVVGISKNWSGPLIVDHAVMADAIDIEPVRAAIQRLGFAAKGQLTPDERGKLVALLAKAEPSQSASLRGFRHTMLDDSDISPTRHARAFVCGALAGLVGDAEIYVSGGAEHQGPDGGGPVAVIARR